MAVVASPGIRHRFRQDAATDREPLSDLSGRFPRAVSPGVGQGLGSCGLRRCRHGAGSSRATRSRAATSVALSHTAAKPGLDPARTRPIPSVSHRPSWFALRVETASVPSETVATRATVDAGTAAARSWHDHRAGKAGTARVPH